MSVQDLAVIFAPTLFNVSQLDNATALTATQEVATIIGHCICNKRGQKFIPNFSSEDVSTLVSELNFNSKRLLDILWEEEEEENLHSDDDDLL